MRGCLTRSTARVAGLKETRDRCDEAAERCDGSGAPIGKAQQSSCRRIGGKPSSLPMPVGCSR